MAAILTLGLARIPSVSHINRRHFYARILLFSLRYPLYDLADKEMGAYGHILTSHDHTLYIQYVYQDRVLHFRIIYSSNKYA